MYCTQCGAEGRGRFCGACGASLRALRCGGCGEEVQAGIRFCTSCGTPVSRRSSDAVAEEGRGSAGASGGASGSASGWTETAGWWVSGGLLGVLLAVVGFAAFGGSGSDPGPTAPPAPAAGPAGGVDLSTMTPREAADRLFNRVVMALEAGDTAEVTNFLPMAMDAYELARPLDEDGLYHLSVLRLAAGDHEGAMEVALEGLEDNPDHLLNLSSAAQAARELGRLEEARGYYERLLEAWDREMALERLEYLEHAPLLPMIREEAQAFLDDPPS